MAFASKLHFRFHGNIHFQHLPHLENASSFLSHSHASASGQNNRTESAQF